MAEEDPRWIFDRLFIAAPEVAADEVKLTDALVTAGVFSRDEMDKLIIAGRVYKRGAKTAGRMRNKRLIERLLIVAPEIFSIQAVNVMRKFDLLTEEQGHWLRISIRGLGAVRQGGSRRDQEAWILRLHRVIGGANSNEAVDLWRMYQERSIRESRRYDLERIARAVEFGHLNSEEADIHRRESKKSMDARLAASKIRADKLRAAVIAGNVAVRAARARDSASLIQALWMITNEFLSKDIVRAMQLSGVLSAKEAAIFNTVLDMAPGLWRTVVGIKAADGFAQRMLLGMQGVMSHELVDAMLQFNIIDKRTARYLRPAVTLGREWARDHLELQGKSRRYRVVPGESPIASFARVSSDSDKKILKLLAQAAVENRREATALVKKPGIGAKTRAGQYNIAAAKLHETMQDMWENIGHLIIRGEAEAARQAFESMQEIQGKVWKRGGKSVEDLAEVLAAQGRAGVDSFISRQENVVALSRLVYKNRDLALGAVDKRINIGLLRGQSAAEMAADVAKMIRPDVPGGVSFAAMRLARTEINNAFHYTSIRHTREMPWVTGYRWHTSRSHPRPDECDAYAKKIWKKSEVPPKPHPQCLCFITPETVEPAKFQSNLKAGHYDRYVKQVERGTVEPDAKQTLTESAIKALGWSR